MTIFCRLLLLCTIMLGACTSEHPSQPTGQLAGKYASTAFTLLDPADRPIDVQASGGSVVVSFVPGNAFTATVNVPQGVSSTMGSGSTAYLGTYSLANDTIRLSGFIVDALKWNPATNSIEAISPARGGISFVLIKK